jgi:hypothetical protein
MHVFAVARGGGSLECTRHVLALVGPRGSALGSLRKLFTVHVVLELQLLRLVFF